MISVSTSWFDNLNNDFAEKDKHPSEQTLSLMSNSPCGISHTTAIFYKFQSFEAQTSILMYRKCPLMTIHKPVEFCEKQV